MRKVDAVYTGLDNLVAENLETVLKASRETRTPVFSGDTESVQRGALATIALQMFDIGKLTGQMVADVLEGSKPSDMPVRVIAEGLPVANHETVKLFNIDEALIEKFGVQYIKPR